MKSTVVQAALVAGSAFVKIAQDQKPGRLCLQASLLLFQLTLATAELVNWKC